MSEKTEAWWIMAFFYQTDLSGFLGESLASGGYAEFKVGNLGIYLTSPEIHLSPELHLNAVSPSAGTSKRAI